MIRIGFVCPSSEYLFDPFKGDPHTHFHILTLLRHYYGDKLALRLIDLRGIKKEFASRHVPECDIYLHSVYTLDFNEQIGLVKELRVHYPKALHMAGGPHVSAFISESLKHFDTLIIGDGEGLIKRAIDDFSMNRLKNIYTQDQKIDLNAYPFPRRDFLPKSTIARTHMMTLKSKPEYKSLLGTTTLFSRGCPFNCAFCAMPQRKEFNTGVLFRRPDLIAEEIEYLKRDYSIQGINLLDEIAIPPGKKQSIRHLEAIGSTNIIWRGQTRVDMITDQTAFLAKESGCVALGLGIESVSQRALDMINKRIKVEDAKKTLKILKRHGIETRAYMILGLPGEPIDIVDQTWTFIQETQPDVVYLSLFTVRPGTDVFDNPKKYGIKSLDTDWEKSMHLFGRYGHEQPTLTFEYEKRAPWGRGANAKEIIENYLELQNRLREHKMSFV